MGPRRDWRGYDNGRAALRRRAWKLQWGHAVIGVDTRSSIVYRGQLD